VTLRDLGSAPASVHMRARDPWYEVVLSQINFTGVPRIEKCHIPLSWRCPTDSVLFLSALLHAERVRRGTRKGTRALGTYKQAVLVLRWFLEDIRMPAPARDNAIAVATAYEYRAESIAILAARRPSLHGPCSPPTRPVIRI
jgi:hypothetical protein